MRNVIISINILLQTMTLLLYFQLPMTVLIVTSLMSSAAENVYKACLSVLLASSILFRIHLLRYKEACHHFEYQIRFFFSNDK